MSGSMFLSPITSGTSQSPNIRVAQAELDERTHGFLGFGRNRLFLGKDRGFAGL